MKALITGASSGIGRDMARYLNKLGVDLILVGRNNIELKKLKEELNNVEIINLDLTILDNVYKLYDKTKDKNIDILINNAGFGLFGNFINTDLNRELEMINLNIVAVHVLSKLFINDFKDKENAYILNVASSAGFMPGPKLATYYATKNYVLKLTLAIYEETRRINKNIHISVLCPGPVNTNFNTVAGGSFNVKSASSEYVAKYGIDKMFKKKLIIIPTLMMKLGVIFSKIIPMKLLLIINYHIQNLKIKHNRNK